MIPKNLHDRVRDCLQNPFPESSLFDLCCELRDDGVEQIELYDFFLNWNDEENGDAIGTVLDYVGGFCGSQDFWVYGKQLKRK